MNLAEATTLIAPAFATASEASTWADLGCGTGLFTRALAANLKPGSRLYALDRNTTAIGHLQRQSSPGVTMETAVVDIPAEGWPFERVDGILMANLLHFVPDQASLLMRCRRHLLPHGRLLVVEYDTERADRWVPYPIGRARLAELIRSAGFTGPRLLGERPSVYGRGGLYAAESRPGPASHDSASHPA